MSTCAIRGPAVGGRPVTGMLRIVDAVAGGDVSRVIIEGAPPLPGDTVAQQCDYLARNHDHIRRRLIEPPHGALHMCPVLLLPPLRDDADFGVIIMESMGYPPISGTNLFCATAVALEYGVARVRAPQTRLRVETPAGVVPVTAYCRSGRCERVEFENVPARIVSRTEAAVGSATTRITRVSAGVDMAVVDAAALGLGLSSRSPRDILVRVGRRTAELTGTDFALFYSDLASGRRGVDCTVAVFQAPAVICRSPTGTGTSAMLVLAHSLGLIAEDQVLSARSITGSRFRGRILSITGSATDHRLYTAVSGEVSIGREFAMS